MKAPDRIWIDQDAYDKYKYPYRQPTFPEDFTEYLSKQKVVEMIDNHIDTFTKWLKDDPPDREVFAGLEALESFKKELAKLGESA